MRGRQRGLIVTSVVAACLAAPAGAAAAPLDDEACTKLAAEFNTFATSGIEKILTEGRQNGPGWALANMTLDDIERIKRYLAVEDDIRFRCPGIDVPEIGSRELIAVPAAAPAGEAVPIPSRRPDRPAKSGKSASLRSVNKKN